jgi:hypothetical protein
LLDKLAALQKRMAKKKERNDCELRDGNLKLVRSVFGNFCNDEGLLAVVFLLGCCCCVKNCLCRMKLNKMPIPCFVIFG